jgi:hypothetical protein
MASNRGVVFLGTNHVEVQSIDYPKLENPAGKYVVTDACGGASLEAHNMAVERMVQAGARPIRPGPMYPNCSATGRVQQPPNRSPNCSLSVEVPLARACCGSGTC